jgi:hypothetical protein
VNKVGIALALAILQEALLIYLDGVPPVTTALLTTIVVVGAVWLIVLIRHREELGL